MSNPRGRNLVKTNPLVTKAAQLPALVVPKTGDKGLDSWLAAATERLQVREGERSNKFEKVVTNRDLVNLGLVSPGFVLSGQAPAADVPKGQGVMLANGVTVSFEDFARSIYDSQLFKDMNKRVDDPTRFDALPKLTRDLLLKDIAAIDGRIDATVKRWTDRLVTTTEAFAQDVFELRATAARSAAGIRQVRTVSASENRAVAADITQVTARIDGVPISTGNIDATVYTNLAALEAAVTSPVPSTYYQVDDPASTDNILYRWDGSAFIVAGHGTTSSASASVEQVSLAVADRVDGMSAEYYVKVQAGNKLASIGLSATEDPDGTSESAFIILADKFALVTPSTTISDPLNPPAGNIPFGADASGVYINGEVRINASGTTLNDLAATTGVNVLFTSEFWKVDSTGAAVNTDIVLTVSLAGGLSGFVDWSKSGAGTAPPTAGTTNTWTIYAADQTDDTCTYTASLVDGAITYTDSVTVVRLRDGSSALTGTLTNETHTVAALFDGSSVNYTGATGTFQVYQGSTRLATPDVAFSYVSSTGFSSAPSGSINATTGVYTITANMNADVATVTYRATIGSDTIDKVFTLTKAKQGIDGAAGASGDDAQLLAIVATGFAYVFEDAQATSSGSPTISFTASLQNATGIATFVATAYNAANTSLGTIVMGGAGTNTRTLTPAQFVSQGSLTTRYVTVVATLGSLSDTYTVYRADGGSDAYGAVLSNESHTVPASSAGVVSSFTGASTTIKVFEGIGDVTSLWTFARSDSGLTTTINGGAGPVTGTGSVTIACTAMSADVGTCTITASRTGYASISKVFTVTKSKAGFDGVGTTGARGSLIGYGTAYGIRSSIWSDGIANRIVSNIVNNASLTSSLASTAENVKGDTITLTNGSPWLHTEGVYSATKAYVRGDMAINTGLTKAYRCIKATTGNTVTNTTYWQEWGTINSRGAWASAIAYAANDVVTGLETDGVTSTSWIASYGHTSTGTFATERDGGGYVEERYWGGSSWDRPGVKVDGNLFVTLNISGGANLDITGKAVFNGVTATADGASAVIVNDSLVADIGLLAYSSVTAGVNGIGTGTANGVSGGAYLGTGAGVSGLAFLSNSGPGVNALSTSLAAPALRTAHTNASGYALEIAGGRIKIISTKFSTGAVTPAFTNKPGAGTLVKWVECYMDTTKGWIPWVQDA